MINFLTATTYQYILKPILFLLNPEKVHVGFTSFGELLGHFNFTKKLLSLSFQRQYQSLDQTIVGIHFSTPVGLAAGFDYEARLTRVLPSIGFGFGTVGTITNLPFNGNPRPILGRLPKSQSLMVNKGFKNQGIKAVVKKLRPYKFDLPVGISIGKTNIIEIDDLESGVSDITAAFKIAEKSSLKHSYYELNISCPNVTGKLSFYDLNNLESLLTSIDALVLSRPVFMKLPISKTDEDFLKILKVISNHKISGIIIGNLQTNRHDPAIVPSEADKFSVGNFSGKPTERRSNELIALAYQKYGNKLVIIGCGGIFSASDAYTKIKAGATLVQLITGMIYKGPQLISQINHDLDKLLKADGYKHISEAVGKGN